MRLLALMYHRAQAGPHGNSPEVLERHFAYLAKHGRCVLPGDWLKPRVLNVCLTFDDGYFDFYSVVYPLLEKYNLRALLAVPISVIRERCDLSAAERLRAPADVTAVASNDGGFCTWAELREMSDSKLVTIAAHGFSHVRLDRDEVDLHTEIAVPQAQLSARIGRAVDTFVFPYGRFSKAALRKVHQSYRYAFRIGGADNLGWSRRMIYRVDADNVDSPEKLFSKSRLALYRVRRFWNRARGR